eukprot:162152-Rhodomonas_salina.1
MSVLPDSERLCRCYRSAVLHSSCCYGMSGTDVAYAATDGATQREGRCPFRYHPPISLLCDARSNPSCLKGLSWTVSAESFPAPRAKIQTTSPKSRQANAAALPRLGNHDPIRERHRARQPASTTRRMPGAEIACSAKSNIRNHIPVTNCTENAVSGV